MDERKTDNLSTWYNRLGQGLLAITEAEQRTFLFATKIIEIEPAMAAVVVDRVLREGFLKSDAFSPLLLDAMVTSLITDRWQGDHTVETVDHCYRQERRLAALFLNGLSQRDHNSPNSNLPLPEYSKERPLTLGERRHIARKPNRRLIQLAMGDPHPMVMTNLLENPKLTEDDIVSVASRRPSSPQVLSEIALHRRFRRSRRLAGALINNPDIPVHMGLALLPRIDFPYLKELLKNPALHTLLREATEKVLHLKTCK